jgi:predicted deacylase
MVAAVVREFDVDSATADRDVRGFLQLLEEKGFLEPLE